jgi:hypothetical protein
VGPLLVGVLVVAMVGVLVLALWKYWPMQKKSAEIGVAFGQRHPTLAAILLSVGIAAAGLAAAWRIADLISRNGSSDVVIGAALGTILGLGGFVVWAYIYLHNFVVSGRLGLVSLGLTVLVAAGACGAFMGLPNGLNALCLALVAARLLPWSVGLLWQEHDSIQHPELRKVKVMRAMILSTGHRPPTLPDEKHI